MKNLIKYSTLALATCCLVACGGEVKEWQTTTELDASRLNALKGSIKNGDISVVGQKDLQKITLQTAFHLESKADLSALAEQIQVELKPAGTQGNIVLKQPDGGDYTLKTDMAIKVPESMALDLSSHNGLMVAENLKANVKLNTSNGQVTASNVTGDVEAISNNGALALNQVTGHTHKAHTSNGGISLKDVNGPIEADTSNGNIEGNLLGVNRPEKYSFSTSNGNIALMMPNDSSVKISYSTDEGEVTTTFTHDKGKSEIMVGKGDAQMSLKTGNGKIAVTTP